jgi:hypothetical protein
MSSYNAFLYISLLHYIFSWVGRISHLLRHLQLLALGSVHHWQVTILVECMDGIPDDLVRVTTLIYFYL